MSAAYQAAVAVGSSPPDGYAEMISILLYNPLPMPQPHRSHARVRQELSACYERPSGRLPDFASGLASPDKLSDSLPAAAPVREDAGLRRWREARHGRQTV